MLITSDLLKERGEQSKVLNKGFLCSFTELFLHSVIATIVLPNLKQNKIYMYIKLSDLFSMLVLKI